MPDNPLKNGSTAYLASSSPSAAPVDQPLRLRGDAPEVESARHQSTAAPGSLRIAAPAAEPPPQPRRGQPRLPPAQGSHYRHFRQLCDRLVEELKKIDDFLDDGGVTEEGLEVVVEVEALLEALYDCPWGKGESLKRVVVAIQSQVNNANWKRPHVAFLKEVLPYLRVRYVIDDGTVAECYAMIKRQGLDPFRGTVSEPVVLKKYRIEEVTET
jgi:hypothetical protein